jgi:hypothetical protein
MAFTSSCLNGVLLPDGRRSDASGSMGAFLGSNVVRKLSTWLYPRPQKIIVIVVLVQGDPVVTSAARVQLRLAPIEPWPFPPAPARARRCEWKGRWSVRACRAARERARRLLTARQGWRRDVSDPRQTSKLAYNSLECLSELKQRVDRGTGSSTCLRRERASRTDRGTRARSSLRHPRAPRGPRL